ncbi:hypothetical protein GCM10007111_33480 [Virgibacillus kapii]|uniref:Uncharacterized protein n=2 Tax=Virgibacillus TaxID=84406 RepID=A0A024QDR4_9BACI|nr:hypothetical protein GCM10007111_33480 [Virgibacillus kapii]CDQ40639.1 hypothetical protein BN990_02965 [Virgibacillus massiliensis]
MKNLPLYGKVYCVAGILFFIFGIFLFVQRIGDPFQWRDHYLPISFIFLALFFMLTSYMTSRKRNKGNN